MHYLRRVWHSGSGWGPPEDETCSRSRTLPPAWSCWNSSWPWRTACPPQRPLGAPLGRCRPLWPRPPPPTTGEGDQGSPLCWRTCNHRLCIRFFALLGTLYHQPHPAAATLISRVPRTCNNLFVTNLQTGGLIITAVQSHALVWHWLLRQPIAE